MAYLGKDVVGIMSYSRAKDTMTGDGSTTTLTLSRDPGTQNNVEIYMDGVLQTPGVEYTLAGKVITFTTAPETGLNVVALSGTETEIMEPADNSVVASHLVGGLTLTEAKIGGLSSSKLSGALPALDGSALTNMPSGINVTSASDPAIDTNHANGVGTTWVNTTSGEMFVCTDATTDANVWFNVGAGTGNVMPYSFQGSIAGYMLGGYQWNSQYHSNIQKFSFASNTGQTSPADMVRNGYSGGAGRSQTDGYYFGGHNGSATTTEFNKFSFGSEGTSSSVGNIALGNYNVSVHDTQDYMYLTQCTEGSETSTNIIERVSTASENASGDIGDMADPTLGGPHTQTDTYGYITGGYRHESPTGNRSRIEKYQFAASVTSATVADAGVNISYGAGASSSTHGIVQHGDYCRRHQFASDADAVAHGNLVNTNLSNKGGSSGENHGYFSGGNRGVHNQGTTGFPDVEQISYASNTTATDWGDLPHGRYGPKGTQY